MECSDAARSPAVGDGSRRRPIISSGQLATGFSWVWGAGVVIKMLAELLDLRLPLGYTVTVITLLACFAVGGIVTFLRERRQRQAAEQGDRHAKPAVE
jgi:ABC-type transport system involved in cytochrome bd biosynthesis fused ATPase/permease subunit